MWQLWVFLVTGGGMRLPRIERLRRLLAGVLESETATASEGCSALASLLMDAFVEEIRQGNHKVKPEMRRMAERLLIFIDTHPDQIGPLSEALADGTTKQ